MKTTEELLAEIELLRAERDEARIKSTLDQATALGLREMLPAFFYFEGALRPALDMIASGEATNYVVTHFTHGSDASDWTLTLQKEDGLTPSQKLAACERKLEAAKRIVERARCEAQNSKRGPSPSLHELLEAFDKEVAVDVQAVVDNWRKR